MVPWTTKLLEKPARLFTRVLNRLAQMQIGSRLAKTTLPPKLQEEIRAEAEWKEGAINDFAASLSEVATIELNKRNVPAQHAHWSNLAISAGELVLAHVTLCNRIDRLVKEADKPVTDQEAPKP